MRPRIFALLLLAGCESDEAKATRLSGQLASAQLTVRYWEGRYTETGKTDDPKINAQRDSVVQAYAKLDVARRAMNKFMAGR